MGLDAPEKAEAVELVTDAKETCDDLLTLLGQPTPNVFALMSSLAQLQLKAAKAAQIIAFNAGD